MRSEVPAAITWSCYQIPTVFAAPLFAGSDQPARRGFGIVDVFVECVRVPVVTRDVLATPFYALVEFARADINARRNLLVVSPLSGHFPILLRDLVIGLIPWFRVHVTDWINVRHVDIADGTFGLEQNIAGVLRMEQHLGTDLVVIALCQAGLPALAAAAALSAARVARAPAHLVLMAAPIDPLANPTRVVGLLRARSLA